MVHRRWLAACTLLAVLQAPAWGDGPGDLKWKFQAGKTTYQVMTTDSRLTMNMQGKDIPTSSKQTFTISWTPVKQLGDKSWEIKQKILALKVDLDIFGQKMEFDSASPSATPLAAAFKPLVGAEFQLTVSPDMKVTKVEGYKDLIDKLGRADPKVKQMMESTFTEAVLKNLSEQYFSILPNRAVKKGDTWTTDARVPLGGFGTMTGKRKLTYEGKSGKLDKINYEITDLKYEPAGANAGGGLPFKIKKVEVKSSTAKGTILFNSDLGRLESSTGESKIVGKMLFDFVGQDVDVDVTQNQTSSIKTSESSPVGK